MIPESLPGYSGRRCRRRNTTKAFENRPF